MKAIKKPEGEPTGKIVISVYENGRTFAEVSGIVPANAIFTCKASLRVGYAKYLKSRGASERKSQAEGKRESMMKIEQEQQEQDKVDAEKQAMLNEVRGKLVKAEADLTVLEAIDPTQLATQEEKKTRYNNIQETRKEIKELKEEIANIEGDKKDGEEETK